MTTTSDLVKAWVHCQRCNQIKSELIPRVLATGLRYGYGKTKDNPIILNHLFCIDPDLKD